MLDSMGIEPKRNPDGAGLPELLSKVESACEVFQAEVDRLHRKLGPDLSNSAIDRVFPEFKSSADSLFARLEKAPNGLSVNATGIKQAKERFRSHPAILPFFETEFNKAALKKRFNYAGDFEVIDLLLCATASASGYQRLFDEYLQQLPAVRAVKERHDLVANNLAVASANITPKRPLRVASIGCGPAKEYLSLLKRGSLPEAEVHLVDTSKEALAFARNRLEKQEASTHFYYHNDDVLDYYKGRLDDLTDRFNGKVDILYCFGVMDYLPDSVVSRTIRTFVNSVAPGGRCLVGNFDPKNPSRAYMEWLLDWPLIYRTKDHLHKLALQSCGEGTHIEIVDVAEGVNNFLQIDVPMHTPKPVESRVTRNAIAEPFTTQASTQYGPPSVEEHRQSVVKGLGYSCLLGTILYPMWILLDAQVVKNLVLTEGLPTDQIIEDSRLQQCFWIRMGVMAYLLLFSFSAFTIERNPQLAARATWFGAAGHLLMGFGLICIMAILDAFGTNYHAGLIMVLIAISTLTPWRPSRTAFELLLIAIGYVVFALIDNEKGSQLPDAVIQNIAFVSGSAVLLSISTFLFPIYRRPKLPPEAVALGIARAKRRGNDGLLRKIVVAWSGVWAGISELRKRNPRLIGICVLALLLLIILAILVWAASKNSNHEELGPLVLRSLIGIISALFGGIVLLVLRHYIQESSGRSDEPHREPSH